MANKTLFSNSIVKRTPKANARNDAGGIAYDTSAEYKIAQYVVTGTFNGTYYASADAHLARMKELAMKANPEFLAKVAVYGHKRGKMKDLPAFCLAVLAARKELFWLRKAWPHVITNVKMLLNFVQIIRSGVLGRRSFGTAIKRMIQDWLTSRDGKQLMMAKIGHSNPSLEDVIKMVHPKPVHKQQEAMFAYIVGRDYKAGDLPEIVQEFELFKLDNSNPLPDLPFRALTNCGLNETHWKGIAENMPWNTLRMNLNTLARNGVFNDRALTQRLAAKIGNESEVQKWNAFPYQLLTTYMNVGSDIPSEITLALQDAMEIATRNVPNMGKLVIAVDLSGSMGSPVTGWRSGGTTETTCKHAAALIASVALRANPHSTVIAWASTSQVVKLNPRDSVMTNADKLSKINVGHGTNAELALSEANKQKIKNADGVIVVSDMQSWMAPFSSETRRWGGTGLAAEWEKFRKRNKGAKLIGINVTGSDGTVQTVDAPDVLNIAGFSDSVFDVIERFVHQDAAHFVDVVNEVEI